MRVSFWRFLTCVSNRDFYMKYVCAQITFSVLGMFWPPIANFQIDKKEDELNQLKKKEDEGHLDLDQERKDRTRDEMFDEASKLRALF